MRLQLSLTLFYGGKMVFWSFLHSIYNKENIIHSPGWFGHVPSVIFPIWPTVVVCPEGNPSIAVLLNWFPLQQYSELPLLGNMRSPGCVNGLQPYVPLACMTPHLVWRWLAAPAPIPFPSFPFQQPPHSSNCLSIQALPSPTAVHFSCLFPPSVSSLFSLLSRCCMGGINNWNLPSKTVFNWGRGLISVFEESNCGKQVTKCLCIFLHFTTWWWSP